MRIQVEQTSITMRKLSLQRFSSQATRSLRERSKGSLHKFVAALLVGSSVLASTVHAELPPENRCPTVTPPSQSGAPADAGALLVKEGMQLSATDVLFLRALFPKEIWNQREAFFYEGMQMLVGPCHRRYVLPDFFTRATEAHRKEAALDSDGNLKNYRAGTPFPSETIDPKAPDAALRWAWNFETRYRGAGFSGKFRLTDVSRRDQSPLTFLGEFFQIFLAQRSDLRESEYKEPDIGRKLWVAGGRFDEPFDARHLAWRQIRNLKSQTSAGDPDDIFVYVPTMRKSRRAATAWVDGLFMPTYHASGDSGGGGIRYGGFGNGYGDAGGTIAPTAGKSIAASENLRRGFIGLSIRPNAYTWNYVGEQEVLAPINSARVGYPQNPDLNFGPYGLSYASDRWDVRYAVVIRGASKRDGEAFDFLTLYIDYQTLQPLYYITQRKNGLLIDIGVLVHRYSGDNANYPQWPNGSSALAFDPVGASFITVGTGGGWRRESYDILSLPPDADRLRRMTSISALDIEGH